MSGWAVTGAGRITGERNRQIDDLNWSAEHDDEHDGGELVDAAWAYLAAAVHRMPTQLTAANQWPFEADAFKPSDDPIVNLVKAGALIAAEIDRLQRAEEAS